ncbi:MAG: sel1 repeat family protein [Deltaproteobacteria bacterium]|jgi:TPR repeat protein|nr:sel1 repeat family protein [Deltaproteobacteria bacterium]
MDKMMPEISETLCTSSCGKANPRGVKRKMSNFKIRKRRESLNRKRDIAPDILIKLQPEEKMRKNGKCINRTVLGPAPNKTEAVKLFRLAAEQGYPNARYNPAFYLFSGDGAAQSKTEALKLFCQAAEQGFADAQRMIDYFLGGKQLSPP